MTDPWATTETVDVAGATYPKSLYNRAMKRQDGIRRTGGRTWEVKGGLGDTYPSYTVTFSGGYTCDCYALDHGAARRHRTCSHVLAVIIWRQQISDGVLPVPNPHPTGASGEPVPTQPTGMTGAGEGSTVPTPESGGEVVVEDAKPSAATPPPVSLPSPRDPRFTDLYSLPEWVEELRPSQWDAIQEAVELFNSGARVVWMDAPTGAGKSLIGEMVRRLLHTNGMYVCHTKTLQDQFLKDFPYARVIKGRTNYPTQLAPWPEVSCADCTLPPGADDGCAWCDVPAMCEYQVARQRALSGRLVVANTAYYLTESNYVGNMSQGRGLHIADECDLLEQELMGFVEFRLGERMLRKLGLTAPGPGSHRSTIGGWLVDEVTPRLREYAGTIPRNNEVENIRERMRVSQLIADLLRMKGEVEKDGGLTGWVRDNEAGPMVLKPVRVDDYGENVLWRHGRRWLCMSATIISAEEMASSLGLNNGNGGMTGGRQWGLVTVPMSFPVENRRVVVLPAADMSKKGREDGQWDVCAATIGRILDKHQGERILIHTVSYELATYLWQWLNKETNSGRVAARAIFTYTRAGERDSVLAKFRRTPGAVLLGASLDRGIDLPGEDCRVSIIAKVPFPYLGDRQVSERLHSTGGQLWYNVQTVRTLVQMAGRAVRSKDDWATTYILDRQFVKNVWAKSRLLIPEWFRDAVVTRGDEIRELL